MNRCLKRPLLVLALGWGLLIGVATLTDELEEGTHKASFGKILQVVKIDFTDSL